MSGTFTESEWSPAASSSEKDKLHKLSRPELSQSALRPVPVPLRPAPVPLRPVPSVNLQCPDRICLHSLFSTQVLCGDKKDKPSSSSSSSSALYHCSLVYTVTLKMQQEAESDRLKTGRLVQNELRRSSSTERGGKHEHRTTAHEG
ncbi:unnamed protein product [Pleuronectes platessa]|uniref:Uncharacterized protein n=1 Tax=Pleuronectes platessa TaxID=8262 RepID=A0A9N7ZE47_PLEPL|nr:unnamed protein product [Pleuronectes platessa]